MKGGETILKTLVRKETLLGDSTKSRRKNERHALGKETIVERRRKKRPRASLRRENTRHAAVLPKTERGARSIEACPVPLPWVLIGEEGREEQGTSAVSETEHTASYLT